MYIVKGPNGTTWAITTRKEDAEAIAKAGPLDKKIYTVEKV
jgi:hypothetical protein